MIYRFATDGGPSIAYSISRETHASDEHGTPTRIQHAFTYSDGFGRVAQNKLQAEPDRDHPDMPRWIGTGTTVYNNKGTAVQQFEPFFSDTHRFGIEKHGVSPTLFFDPMERLVCTVHPDGTFEKVLVDPWRQTIWDTNDTVLLDPRTDPDVAPLVADYFQATDRQVEDEHGESPKTWHARMSASSIAGEQETALKTELHAATPTVAHLDSLGRTFLTISHHRTADGTDEKLPLRLSLDIEGQQREVVDAKGRAVMRYQFDMLGNQIHQTQSRSRPAMGAQRRRGQ